MILITVIKDKTDTKTPLMISTFFRKDGLIISEKTEFSKMKNDDRRTGRIKRVGCVSCLSPLGRP